MEEKGITEFENRFPGKVQKKFNLTFDFKKEIPKLKCKKRIAKYLSNIITTAKVSLWFRIHPGYFLNIMKILLTEKL